MSTSMIRFLTSAFAMLALLWSTPATSADPLRVSLSQSPLSLPFYVADNQGYFTAEGVALTITEAIGGHRSLQHVLEGSADLATSSEAVVMFNSFERNDFAIIATFVTSEDDVKVIAQPGSGILSARQLAGKRVGTVVGSAAHYYLDTLLLLNGVDPKSIHMRTLQPEAMTEALRNGEVDAIAIWEPFPFKALQSLPGARMLPKSGNYRLTFNLIASNKLRGARDDDLVRLLRALERAEQFIRTQPGKAQTILRERLKLDQSFINWIWPSYHYRLSLDQSLLVTLEGVARWARQEGYAKREQSPNYLNYIHSDPLRRAVPAAVSIGN